MVKEAHPVGALLRSFPWNKSLWEKWNEPDIGELEKKND